MKIIILLILALILLSCSSTQLTKEKEMLELLEISKIKLTDVNCSDFPEITFKVILRDTANNPIINLAPPYGHLHDWQKIWKPLILNHPFLYVVSLREFTVTEHQPQLDQMPSHLQKPIVSIVPTQPETDIIFVFDDTGSMSDKVDSLKTVIDTFILKLKEKNLDYRFGLVTFKDEVAIQNQRQFVESTDGIRQFIHQISVNGGGDGPENSLDALVEASKYEFRKNCGKILILITDAPPHENDLVTKLTKEKTIEILKQQGINCSIIGPYISIYADESGISSLTGGKFYNISGSFSQAMMQIAEKINPLLYYYIIKYKTPYKMEDGTIRDIKMLVTDFTSTGQYKAPLSISEFEFSGFIFDKMTKKKIPNSLISVRPQHLEHFVTTRADSNGFFKMILPRTKNKYGSMLNRVGNNQ